MFVGVGRGRREAADVNLLAGGLGVEADGTITVLGMVMSWSNSGVTYDQSHVWLQWKTKETCPSEIIEVPKLW
jgi:hypothetical protein